MTVMDPEFLPIYQFPLIFIDFSFQPRLHGSLIHPLSCQLPPAEQKPKQRQPKCLPPPIPALGWWKLSHKHLVAYHNRLRGFSLTQTFCATHSYLMSWLSWTTCPQLPLILSRLLHSFTAKWHHFHSPANIKKYTRPSLHIL